MSSLIFPEDCPIFQSVGEVKNEKKVGEFTI